MLLAQVEDVRNELTFSDIPDIETAIEGALKATTRVLERKLRTGFDLATYTDYFLIPPDAVLSQPRQQQSVGTIQPAWQRFTSGIYANSPLYGTEIALNNGFLLDPSAVTVQAATMIPYFTDGDPNNVADLRAFEADGLDHTLVTTEGRIYIMQVDVRGLYIEVVYQAGFTVASDNVYDNVPAWLEEAAILHAQIMLDKNPIIRRPEGAESQIDVLLRQVNTIIDENIRYFPGAHKPMNR